MDFYAILQNILDDQGLTVTDAARICKIPYSTLKSIIRRKSETTTLEIALKISEGLKVPMKQLCGIEKDSSTLNETKFLDKFRLLKEEDQNLIIQTIELVSLNKLKKTEAQQKEAELLKDFRQLNEDGQNYILQTMKMALGTYEKRNDVQKKEA